MQSFLNFSLKQCNTFGLDVNTKELIVFESLSDIENILEDIDFENENYLILGGGSNLLFLKDFQGIAMKMNTSGIRIIDRNSESVIIEAEAGETWDKLVTYCVDNEFYGIENLRLIPGNVGAAPVQNIGAYGVELKDCFHSLTGYDLVDKEKREFYLNDCRFDYRDSIFKNEYKNRFLITSVRLKLSITKKLNLHYRALKEEFGRKNEEHLSIQEVSEAIRRIRESKLPDVSKYGNAGSFFKNPEIDEDNYFTLKNQFPSLAAFHLGNGNYKLAAAWLIEQCGFKGKRIGNVGCYQKQPLVIVNYGEATGLEIKEYSEKIQNAVFNKFGLTIIPEVNIIQ